MLIIECDRDSCIEIGPDVTVRVISVGRETVELEIDTSGDVYPGVPETADASQAHGQAARRGALQLGGTIPI